MTDNDNAATANDTGLPKEAVQMTRQQLQDSALVIESLLDAVMAMVMSEDRADVAELVEMAQSRANRLNQALDLVNSVEVQA